MVGLAAFPNAACNVPNRRIGIVVGRTRNRLAGTIVTIEKPCKGDNCFMTGLSVGVTGKHLNKIGYHFGDANITISTPFTPNAVKSPFADERNRIIQCLAKGFE
jgi:hypothetical protein